MVVFSLFRKTSPVSSLILESVPLKESSFLLESALVQPAGWKNPGGWGGQAFCTLPLEMHSLTYCTPKEKTCAKKNSCEFSLWQVWWLNCTWFAFFSQSITMSIVLPSTFVFPQWQLCIWDIWWHLTSLKPCPWVTLAWHISVPLLLLARGILELNDKS